jgi:hypothetical protein
MAFYTAASSHSVLEPHIDEQMQIHHGKASRYVTISTPPSKEAELEQKGLD